MKPVSFAFVSAAIGAIAATLSAGVVQVNAGTSGPPFTAAQAARGAKAYSQSCASCHGAKLQGVSAPALVGKTSGVAQQSVAEAYAYISQQMPMTAPGTLSSAQYLSIMAYVLQKNGHRAGMRPLSLTAAKSATTTVGNGS